MTIAVDKTALKDGFFVERDIYTSEAVFEAEKQNVFYKSWHFACLLSDVKNPGDYFTMSVIDNSILIVRGKDGVLRAFHNACTHRGASLHNKRSGNCPGRFTCIYHAWTFNLEGELVGVPHKDAYGPDWDRKNYDLVPVRCESYNDLVFVSVNPDVMPLDEYLGEMKPVLDIYGKGIEAILRNSWIYDGNWKLWHENFRDNYHPQYCHRAINDATPHYADRGGNWALSPGHSRLMWISEQPNPDNLTRAMRRFSGVDFPEGAKPMMAGGDFPYKEAPQEVLAVFPNMDMQPGSAAQTDVGKRGSRMGHIQTVTPLGPNRARVDYICYSSTDDDPETRKAMLEGLAEHQGSWGKVSNDDVEAAIRCQTGLKGTGTRFSPFTRGIKPGQGDFTPNVDARDEYSLREFYRVYNQYMAVNQD